MKLRYILLFLSLCSQVECQWIWGIWKSCYDDNGDTLNSGTGSYAYFSYSPDYFFNDYQELVRKHGNSLCDSWILTFDNLRGSRYWAGWAVSDPCPSGYYAVNYLYREDPPIVCEPCAPGAYNSLKPENSHYSANGNFQNACNQWICDAGFYRSPVNTYPSNDKCTPCPFNTYSTGNDDLKISEYEYAKCQNCPKIDSSYATKSACSAGQYYVLSPLDCKITSCEYCTKKPSGEGPLSTYFVSIDGVSADSQVSDGSASCYWDYCPPCPTGSKRAYCGIFPGNLASVGTCIQCRNIDVFAYYETPTDIRYYLPGEDENGDCNTAPCLLCDAGYYNIGCPVSWGNAYYQPCSQCNPNPILNSQYDVAVGYVASANDCPMICSPGFYEKTLFSSFECQKCSTSNTCLKGFYTDFCNNHGTGEATCLSCPISNFPSFPAAIWIASLPEFGPLACQWHCQIKFYKTGGTCLPCNTTGLTCQIGQYIKATCLLEQASDFPPECAECAAISNAVFLSAATVENDPKSCSFVCMDGFWLSAEQTCSHWTTTKVCQGGKMLGGGNSTMDDYCIDCPDLPKVSAYDLSFQYTFPVVGNCAWTCQPGFYIADSQCKSCPSGKFKVLSGDGPCTLCADGFFQDNKDRAQYCDEIPLDSTSMADRTFFICNQGKELIIDPFDGFLCEPCTLFPSNLKSRTFAPNSCLSSAFLCNSGFYRSIGTDPTQNTKCISCPHISNSVDLWKTISGTVDSIVQRTCGKFPSCPDPNDEINVACPISCTFGNYLYSNANTFSCPQCSPVTCSGGTISSLCRNGEISDQCTSCSYSLTEGQVWVSTDSTCKWQCSYGYEKTESLLACQKCSQGTYKSVIFLEVCSLCDKGSYNNMQAQSSCFLCLPGTYSNVIGLNLCLDCQPGTFSSAYGSTVCTLCPKNTFMNSLAATICTECPAALPFFQLGSTQCSLPPPPCPPGFYFSSSDNICLGCISGVYCPGGMIGANHQMPLPCPWTSSFALYTQPLSSSLQNCSSVSHCARLDDSSILRNCPANTGTRGYSKALSALWCHPNSGYYGFPGMTAQPCPQDSYCTLGVTTISPTPCPISTPYSRSKSITISNCSSIMYFPCRPGYFTLPTTIAGVCFPCPESSYCLGYESTIAACLPGSTWYSPSLSKSPADCISKTLPVVTFTSCPTNTAIPKNTFGNDIYMSSTLQCRSVAGFYFIPGYHTQGIVCPSGYYCPAASLTPITCPPKLCTANGSMQTANICPIQSSSMLAECQPCAGILIANAHYIAVNSCLFCCNAGYILVQFSSTFSCIAAVNTSSCGENMYVPFIDLSGCSVSIVGCQSCTEQITLGSSIIPSRLRLPMLQSGQLPVYGVGACLLGCLPGYYYNNAGSCTACPAGKFRGGDISINSYATSCLNCDSGKYAYYDASTQCLQCLKWTIPAIDDYCLNCSSFTTSYCKVCSQWSMPANGRINCTCISGTYMSAPSIIDGSMSCIECPLGSISIKQGSSCVPCPPGSFCKNLMAPQICPAGWYRANPKSSCMPCLKGYFTISPDSIQCIPCSPGFYSNVANATVCLSCPPNTFLSAIGGSDVSQCLPCTLAWVPSSVSPAGSGQCDCPANTYFNGYECKACTSICHPNATISNPCLFGSTVDTATCTCNPGFAGDGILACSLCLNPNECVCARGSHYDFIDI